MRTSEQEADARYQAAQDDHQELRQQAAALWERVEAGNDSRVLLAEAWELERQAVMADPERRQRVWDGVQREQTKRREAFVLASMKACGWKPLPPMRKRTVSCLELHRRRVDAYLNKCCKAMGWTPAQLKRGKAVERAVADARKTIKCKQRHSSDPSHDWTRLDEPKVAAAFARAQALAARHYGELGAEWEPCAWGECKRHCAGEKYHISGARCKSRCEQD